MYLWQPNAPNTVKFVLVDITNSEVTGLGSNFTVELEFPGASGFVGSSGIKSEIGFGWYKYESPAGEAASRGLVPIKVTGSGATQQNLFATVGDPEQGFGATMITVQAIDGGIPVDGAEVWLTSDAAGSIRVTGTFVTNAQGNVNFWLDDGTYYVWIQHGQHAFTNPTQITVA